MSKGCVQPVKGPVLEEPSASSQEVGVRYPVVSVGKEAPDFEANAFVAGEFKVVRLSEFRGKWVVLCFYPGDFTFV